VINPKYIVMILQQTKQLLIIFFEVKLDMDELCQFSNMLICPYVKEVIKNLITKLSQEGTSLKKNFNITNKYSANGSRNKGLRAKITMYNTNCHNLMRVFMYKKAYGAKDNKKNCETNKKEHNVLLIGDSHARGCTIILQDKLKDQYMVTGFVKPRANVENLITMVKDDHLIFWRGANNVSRTPMPKSLNKISKYLKEKQHTNITVINIPQ